MKKGILTAGVTVLMVVVSVAVLLLFTGLGFAISIRMISWATGDTITVEKTSGRLFGQWAIHGLQVRTADAELSVRKLSVDWRPDELWRGTFRLADVHAEDVALRLANKDVGSSPAEGALALPEFVLPLSLVVQSLQLNRLALYRDDKEKPLTLEHLSTSFSVTRGELSIADLVVQLPEYRAGMRGTLLMSGDWPVDVTGTWTVDRKECVLMGGGFELSGPLEKMDVSLFMAAPEQIDLQGVLFNLLGSPRWKIDGTAYDLSFADVCSGLPAFRTDVQLYAEGGMAEYRLELHTEVRQPQGPVIDAALSVVGKDQRLLIEAATIRVDGSESHLDGWLSWKDALRWSVSLATRSLDFSRYQDFISGLIDLEMAATGSLVEGKLAYEVAVPHFRVTLEDFARTAIGNMEFRGDGEGIEILAAQLQAGEKERVAVRGKLGWRKGWTWETWWTFAGIDPSQWTAMPEGVINGELHSAGQILNDTTTIKASLSSMTGVVAGYPMSGRGAIEYLAGDLAIRDVSMGIGPNSLVADGTIGKNFNVHFQVDGHDLSLLHDRAGGNVQISASLLGPREKPVVDFLAHADNLVYGEVSLKALDVSGTFDELGNMEASLGIEEMKTPAAAVDAVQASVSGGLNNHVFSLHALSEMGKVAIDGSGQLDETQQWAGVMQNITYIHPEYGQWQQKGVAQAAASSTAVSVDNFCFASAGNNFCTAGGWSLLDGWTAELFRLDIALADLSRWGRTSLPVRGNLRGAVSLAGDGAVVKSGSGRITVGDLHLAPAKKRLLEEIGFVDTALSMEIEESTLQATIRAASDHGATVNGHLSVEKFGDLSSPFYNLPVKGIAQVAVVDLGFLKFLTDDAIVPSGHIAADFALSGTFNDPELQGKVILEEGGMFFPDYGAGVKDIVLDLQGDTKTLNADITAQSGEGVTTGTGLIIFADNTWSGELTIAGDSLKLLHQRELQVTGNPRLRLTVSPEGGKLTGTLFVPTARIRPEEMSISSRQSRDTIFVDDLQPQGDFPFSFDLNIELGDDIQIEGFGFKGFLLGNLEVTDRGTGEILGRGGLQIKDGSVSFMGRVIQVSRGIVTFSGGPVDNPSLDIQARKIISRTRSGAPERIVGLNITGTAHDYHVELFSVPKMQAREILAALLRDRPANSEDVEADGLIDSAVRLLGSSGGNNVLGIVGERLLIDNGSPGHGGDQGQVRVVGKQLTERISAGYDYNLFQNQGQFRIRYELPRGFFLEVKNSVDVTGVELLYFLGK
jgi:translocation and assembly module TamB